MSFSSEEQMANPTKRYIDAKNGRVSFYDKNLADRVDVPVPFEFIVLDRLSCAVGWSDEDQSGYWSNEVRNVNENELSIRTSKGIKETGLWKDIKSKPSVAGSKFATSLYIAHKSKGGMDIANLKLTGSSLRAWIEFTGHNNIRRGKVSLSGWKEMKKGAVAYKVPEFELVDMTDEERTQAKALDEKLQYYFKESLKTPVREQPKKVEEDETFDDIPF